MRRLLVTVLNVSASISLHPKLVARVIEVVPHGSEKQKEGVERNGAHGSGPWRREAGSSANSAGGTGAVASVLVAK